MYSIAIQDIDQDLIGMHTRMACIRPKRQPCAG
jgi:hypothetical protein